ncbi:MAG TPA: hypothetical protein ENN81_06775 [Phycisphaerales bacterium]|nr:hypothetical protein [Phycisphaerales bacterium]
MEQEKKNSTPLLIAVAIILVGAVGVGFGVRHVRHLRQSLKEMPRMTKGTSEIEPEPAAVVDETPPPVVESVEPEPEPEPVVEIVEVPVEEPVMEADESTVKVVEETPLEPQPQPQPQWQFGQNAALVQQFLADLNLNEEEQVRLREGIAMRMQRFQTMSEQERQEEVARMRQMGERWQAMSEPERQAVLQRMRERFEDWRRSGSAELPELSLD